jgi:GTP cyclohydrolase IA
MIDEEKIKQAVTLFLEGIGEDPAREGLVETPDRIARMCGELFAGLDATPEEHLSKRFTAGGSEMVVEKDVPFYSVCEHHLLPFFGHAHIAYVPDGEVVGISKLARTVEVFAKRPQIQERLTGQICDAIMDCLHPKGVMVMMEAEHMCMSMRGVRKPGTQTVTTAVRGCFVDDDRLQNRFFQMVQR